jgi:4-hydroxy-3-polyprenylbenzoate decarboxylase
MAVRDLREWIDLLEKEGEVQKVSKKVDWNLEIGGVTQESFDREGPAILFENIKDYENSAVSKRFFTGGVATYPRIALMLGVPKNTPPQELVKIWRERSKSSIKPKIVPAGPCKENIIKGDEIDLLAQFPVPFWHKHDGGRYLGTFDGVVTKERDGNWINVGNYRRMVHNKNQVGVAFPLGQHIWEHWRTYRKKGENVPVAWGCGWNPILPSVSCSHVARGVCEYDVMGGLLGEPIELVKCETNDLLVPASAEIVFEGELNTNMDTFIMEGPFGEYTGYYCTVPSKRPVITIKCITFRNDPIFRGTLEGKPINEDHRICSIHHSASLWDLLDERMTGVIDVSAHPSTGWANVFVQIDNSYFGQVAQVAANIFSTGMNNMVGKNVFVFDKDIDIWNLNDVMWAMGYRITTDRGITKVPGWISPLDPSVHPKDSVHEAIKKGDRLIFDCTKPIDWPRTDKWFGEKFPHVAYPDDETMASVRKSWDEYGFKR